jgi:hypothetical protein
LEVTEGSIVVDGACGPDEEAGVRDDDRIISIDSCPVSDVP